MAAELSFENAQKKDSQDICFIPNGNYVEFIEKYDGYIPCPGDFIDSDGHVLGKHKGIWNYTIGQRRGIGVGFGKPMYVIGKNADNNTVTLGTNELLFTDTLYADNLNWIAFDKPRDKFRCKAKTRYRQVEQPCTVYPENDKVKVVFVFFLRAVTPGQHIVFYEDDIVVGGGVIM